MEDYIEEKLQEEYDQNKIEFEVLFVNFRIYKIVLHIGKEYKKEQNFKWNGEFTPYSNYDLISKWIDSEILQYYKNEF